MTYRCRDRSPVPYFAGIVECLKAIPMEKYCILTREKNELNVCCRIMIIFWQPEELGHTRFSLF